MSKYYSEHRKRNEKAKKIVVDFLKAEPNKAFEIIQIALQSACNSTCRNCTFLNICSSKPVD